MRGFRLPLVAVVIAVCTADVAAPAAAPGCITWMEFAKSSQFELPIRDRLGLIAGGVTGATKISRYLQPSDRPKLEAVNYRRYVVVAALRGFSTGGYEIQIDRIVRKRRALFVRVTIEPPQPGAGVLEAGSTAYDVVAVPRAALGHNLPTRVVVRDAPGSAASPTT